MPASLISAYELRDVTVRLGRFRRERVFIYGYDDGRHVIGYPLYVGDSFVVVDLATVPSDA